jgi:hypothetical protein
MYTDLEAKCRNNFVTWIACGEEDGGSASDLSWLCGPATVISET